MAHNVTLAYALQGRALDQIDTAFSVADEDSKVFLVAQADAVAGTPTAAQIIAGQDADGNPAPSAGDTGGLVPVGAVGGLKLGGLDAGTYDVFAVATDVANANEGAVDSITGVVLTENTDLVGGGSDFPANPNPDAPDGTASTLPDAADYSLNPFAEYVQQATALQPAAGATAVATRCEMTVAGTAYVAATEIGATPPTAAEVKAALGFAGAANSALLADTPVDVSITGLETTKAYEFWVAFETAGDGLSEYAYAAGYISLLDSQDAPYDGALPAGFAYKDPNAAIAVNPATVVNLPTT